MKSKVIAISGALEEDSPIQNILKICGQIESKLSVELIDIRKVPLLNIDLFQQDFPEPIKMIRKKVYQSDGLIFAIPQFLGKVSPAFKNIFDWLSWSPNVEHPAPIRGMPACLISIGAQEGTSVHKHLVQMSNFCRVQLMVKPTFHFSKERINNFRNLQNISRSEIEQLTTYLEYFAEFIAKKSKAQ